MKIVFLYLLVFAFLLLFDRLHTRCKRNISWQQKRIKQLLHETKQPLTLPFEMGRNLTSASSWLAKERISCNDLFISHRYSVRKKSARSGSQYFYKWTLKGNGKSDVSVKEFFNLYAESSFLSMQAHFQHCQASQLYFYTHSLQGTAQYNHSLRLRAAEQLQPSSWGSRAPRR